MARNSEKMSNTSFKLMNISFKLLDFIHPYVQKEI